MVALADPSRAAELKELLPSGVHLEAGPDALADVCASADVVVNVRRAVLIYAITWSSP